VECGAQVLQVFESWAHHLSEEQFTLFAKVRAHTCIFCCSQNWQRILLCFVVFSGFALALTV
jgi:uroporphyrinogen-III decarboxylase